MPNYDNRDTGALFKNDKRGNDRAPDYTGDYTTPDGQKRRVAAWLKKSDKVGTYLSLKFSDMRERQPTEQPKDHVDPVQDGFDDIPF